MKMSEHRSVLIIRPYPAAQRTSMLITAHGFKPFVIPLSIIRPVHAAFPKNNYNAVVATSASAFLRPLPRDAAYLAKLPLYCTGRRTAQAAHGNGFTSIAAITKTARSLCAEIGIKTNKRFIYLAGRHRRPELENHFLQYGLLMDSIEVYEIELLTLSEIQRAKIPKEIDFILIYSTGSTSVLTSLADMITPKSKILCLSSRIAAALPDALEGEALYAREPTEKALLSLLFQL